MVISSERLREVLHLGQKEPVAYPEKYSRYKDLFRKVIRPCCLELTGMTDICVKSVEPVGVNWEKAPSLKVATKSLWSGSRYLCVFQNSVLGKSRLVMMRPWGLHIRKLR